MKFSIQFSTTGLYRLAGMMEAIVLVWAVSRSGWAIGILTYVLLRFLVSAALGAIVDWLERLPSQS